MSNASYHTKVFLAFFICICLFFGFKFYPKQYNTTGDKESSKKLDQHKSNQTKVVENTTYIHSDNSFKFNFSDNLKFSNLAEDELGASNETIIFSSTEINKGFQIFISSYFGDAPLGINMIIKGNPDIEVFNSQAIDFSFGKVISFLAKPEGADFTTREIWFTHEGKLYQASTFIESEKDLEKVLNTWEWASS